MGRRSTVDRPVTRVDGDTDRSSGLDAVVVEAPIEVRVGGEPLAVVMRTPGADEDWVYGFLFGEGVVRDPAQILEVRRPDGLKPEEVGNVLEVTLDADASVDRAERYLFAASACGVCGKSAMETLAVRAPFVRSSAALPAARLADLPRLLREAQTVFESTGGLHAAALFRGDGPPVVVREDVGRHNAVDKVVGWALRAGTRPPLAPALCVSGRLGFEIVQKAVVAQIPIVAAVSAPSSLAVDVADRFGVTVCGFVREGRMNVYTHPRRVT